MAVMIYNYLNVECPTLLENTETTLTFKDQDEISAWAQEAVMTLKELNMVHGKSDGNYKPKDKVTRAEAATMMCRLSEMLETDRVSKTE